MRIRSYPKVYNLGHAAIAQLFDDPIVLQEKIDGSQFSFGVFDGELQARSKGQQLIIDAPEKMFTEAVEAVTSLKDVLCDGWVYRGEYLKTPKHNVLAYDRTPEKHIILFDIDVGEQAYISPHEAKAEADRIGLECVPLFEAGIKIDSLEQFKELIDRQSILGGQKIEGVVVKNYYRYTRDGKAMMGKYVSEKYREIHGKDWKNRNPGQGDIIQIIGQSLRTESRWNKAIQHLRERGEIEDSPRDIGKLLKEIQKDTKEETEEIVKKKLYAWAWPNIQRILTAGMPEWYKEELAKKQFEK